MSAEALRGRSQINGVGLVHGLFKCLNTCVLSLKGWLSSASESDIIIKPQGSTLCSKLN